LTGRGKKQVLAAGGRVFQLLARRLCDDARTCGRRALKLDEPLQHAKVEPPIGPGEPIKVSNWEAARQVRRFASGFVEDQGRRSVALEDHAERCY
jgi:hypothetical protein